MKYLSQKAYEDAGQKGVDQVRKNWRETLLWQFADEHERPYSVRESDETAVAPAHKGPLERPERPIILDF